MHEDGMTARGSLGAAPVIVIDLQTVMFDGKLVSPIHGAAELVAHVRAVIAWARRTGHAVAFIRHNGEVGDPLAPGEAGWPVWPALGQADGEPTFEKSVGDAFSNAAFTEWVGDQGADGVILLGAQTDYCVAATVTGAMKVGFKVTVVSDAHSTWDFGGETAEAIMTRYNAVFAEAGATLISTQGLTALSGTGEAA